MKTKLLEILDEIIELLHMTNFADKAEWFCEKKEIILNLYQNSKEFKEEVANIDRIMSGMGSFTDMPLSPLENCKFSRRELRDMQWDLAKKLGEVTAKLR